MDGAKIVAVFVPESFEVPEIYKDTSVGRANERATALRLGAEALDLFEERSAEAARLESHEEAVKKAAAAFDADAAKLQAQVRRAEEALRAAQFRVDALEQSAATQRQEAMREAKEAFQGVLEAKEGQIRQLQASLERQMELVATKVDGLHSSLTKTFSSSKEKGQLGETLMENILKRAFDCDIQAVSKEQQTADIRMTRGSGAQYFWEVKNYTRMVNPDEIEKFRRDLRLHPAIRAGVLVSLRTGIVGKGRSGDVDMEFLEDGRPILFLSNFMSREDPVFALQGLRPFLDILESIRVKAAESSEEGSDEASAEASGETVAMLKAKATLITNLLKSHEAIVAKHRNALVGHKKRIDTMFVEFQGYIVEAEAQLQALLRVAMGGEGDVEAVRGDAELKLPLEVFSRENLMECGDKRVQEFLKWLLGVCEVAEEGELEIRELVEAARKEGYGEKWIKGLREDLFRERAWSKGARIIYGLRWKEVEGSA